MILPFPHQHEIITLMRANETFTVTYPLCLQCVTFEVSDMVNTKYIHVLISTTTVELTIPFNLGTGSNSQKYQAGCISGTMCLHLTVFGNNLVCRRVRWLYCQGDHKARFLHNSLPRLTQNHPRQIVAHCVALSTESQKKH